MGSEAHRPQRRREKRDHGQQRESREHAQHEGEEELHRHATSCFLGGQAPVGADVAGQPVERRGERYTVAIGGDERGHQTVDRRAEHPGQTRKGVGHPLTALDPVDHGFMYNWSFCDPDGHHWEPLWMDPKAADA